MISVIIPTYNESLIIDRAIRQFDTLSGDWEIIVADSGSSDGTPTIASSHHRVNVIDVPVGRGKAMNAGAEAATGDILLFLHADTLLPAGAYQLIINALADPATAATAFRLRMDRRQWRYRILSTVSWARFRIQRTFFGDQSIAVRRSDFEQMGGYREPVLMEDVELSKRLRSQGRLRLLPEEVITSARRFERHGVARTLVMMGTFQILYALGVSATVLAHSYRHARRQSEDPEILDQPLSALTFEDESGRSVSLADFRGVPVLLVFLRWLG